MKKDAFPLFRGHWQLRCQNSLFTVPDFFVTSSGSRADTEGAGYDTHPRRLLLTQSAYGKTGDSEQFTAKMFPEFTQVSLLSGLCGYRKLHRKVKCLQQQAMKMLIVKGIYQGLLNLAKFRSHTVSQQECVFDNRNCNSCFHSTLQHDCFQSQETCTPRLTT